MHLSVNLMFIRIKWAPPKFSNKITIFFNLLFQGPSKGAEIIRIGELSGKLDAIARNADTDMKEFQVFQLAKELGGSDQGHFVQVHATLLKILEVKNASDIEEATKEFQVFKMIKGILT